MLGTLFRFAFRAGIASLVVKALLQHKRSGAQPAGRVVGNAADFSRDGA